MPPEGAYLIAGNDNNAVAAVQLNLVLGDFGGAELSEQVDVAADERDVDFELGQGGGDLDADEAAADDNRVACRRRRVADRRRVIEAAQGEDACQISTRDLKSLCWDTAGD